MIPRTLVPPDVRPAAADAPQPRRFSSSLDDRKLVDAAWTPAALETRTSIPAHLPLDALAARVVIPRDMPQKPLEVSTAIPDHVPLTVLDTRITVPKNAQAPLVVPSEHFRPPTPREVVDPDILTTGEVNLLIEPVEQKVQERHWIARVSSTVFHIALIAFVLLEPKLFPYQPPTKEQMELARRQLSFVYLPPSVSDVPKEQPSPSERSSPKMKIDPRVFRELAPPTVEPKPLPGPKEPERVIRDLPSAPKPTAPQPSPGADQLQSRVSPDLPRPSARLEEPKTPEAPNGLTLPRISPGRALEESIRGAMKKPGAGEGGGFGGPIPPGPAGGGGQGYLGGAVQMLTPDEGVDFNNYLARVLASVKRNWYAVIPESARLGDRGRVVLQFRIMRDGSVPYPEPVLMATSGKEPLDRAALSSIRASSPFEQLPPAFSGPYIELRFIFLYNMSLDAP